jgi:hypothetical protein
MRNAVAPIECNTARYLVFLSHLREGNARSRDKKYGLRGPYSFAGPLRQTIQK